MSNLIHFKKYFRRCVWIPLQKFCNEIVSNQTTFHYKQIRWASTQSTKPLSWTDYRHFLLWGWSCNCPFFGSHHDLWLRIILHSEKMTQESPWFFCLHMTRQFSAHFNASRFIDHSAHTDWAFLSLTVLHYEAWDTIRTIFNFVFVWLHTVH